MSDKGAHLVALACAVTASSVASQSLYLQSTDVQHIHEEMALAAVVNAWVSTIGVVAYVGLSPKLVAVIAVQASPILRLLHSHSHCTVYSIVGGSTR